MDGHPATGSPKQMVLTRINNKNRNAIIHTPTPSMETMARGAVENPMIPSKLYLNNFQKDHFVSPAFLYTFSNSIHFVLNPTHPKIPFEKRL